MPDQPPPRRRFQFRLRTLMIGVVAASFAMAAIRYATIGWAIATVSVTVFSLLFSVVLAAYRRPFWVGFAICGIGYLMLAMVPFMSDLHDLLFTYRARTFLQTLLHSPADYPAAGAYGNFLYQFRFICECLWALVFALLGGMLARFAAGRSPCPGRS